jgi:hypothetical protein
MDSALATRIDESEKESADLDLKAGFDPAANQDWCELVKDIVAMANSGGGLIIFGVNDDGTAAKGDLNPLLAIDPAKIADKIRKYTDQHFDAFSLVPSTRQGEPVAALVVGPVFLPIVFTDPGTYDIGGGKQKTAFARGTVYFRHGAKSEPGTTEDLRQALNKELDRVRSSWLDGINKVVTAPIGATISVLPADVKLAGSDTATSVRLVNDENAPAFKAYRTDLLYPYRQKELVARVNALLDGHKVSPHDVHCARKGHGIDAQPNFFYKPQFSSPQYSEAFAEWMVEQYRADDQFFLRARETVKKHETS